MCRYKPPEPEPECKYDRSSLRGSSLLRAEHMMYEHKGGVTLFKNCKECGAEFTIAEQEKHLNHSSSTFWAGVYTIEQPICQKCREADPEYGYEGQCSYCDCEGCTTAVPRQHCGKGSILVVSGYGSYVTGCRRHKKGVRLPTPHKTGDVSWRDPCECAECRRKRG